MAKLYVVGVTEDRTGLVLARSRRAKSGESVLEVDQDVLEAIAEIRRYRAGGTAPPSISSPALPSRRATAGEVSTASKLSPREIQARVRRGESIASVARRAGVEEWRIEVYAAPIAAEQARVVSRAREAYLAKRGAGPSGRPLGEAVQANVVEKKIPLNVDQFESAWSAFEPEPDRWIVRFEYVSRGHKQMAEWTYDPDDEEIAASNRVATALGWRDPKRTGRLAALPDAPVETTPARKKKPAAKKAPAKKKPAAKRAPAKKKPAVKKAPAKRAPVKKKPPAKKKPAAKRAPAKKKPTTRKKPAKKKSPPAARRALRVVATPVDDAAPDTSEPTRSLTWRDELARMRESEGKRDWRAERLEQEAGGSLDTPSWLREDEDEDATRADIVPISGEDEDEEDDRIVRLPAPAPSRVRVEAERAGGRRGRPGRRRPLRAR